MKSISLIAADMDGTLLADDHSMSERTVKAIIRAQQKGVRFVLASGRNSDNLLEYEEMLHMREHGGFFICMNGALIYDAAGRESETVRMMTDAEAKEVFAFCEPYETETMAMLGDSIYDLIPAERMAFKRRYRNAHGTPDSICWVAGAFQPLRDYECGYNNIYYINSAKELPEKLGKVCMAHEDENALYRLYADINERLGDRYTTVRTTPWWLECAPKEVSKGSALRRILARLGIPKENAAVFGDGENDLSMFAEAGVAVAMENAMDTVKAKASAVTLTNNEDGVADYIERYVL